MVHFEFTDIGILSLAHRNDCKKAFRRTCGKLECFTFSHHFICKLQLLLNRYLFIVMYSKILQTSETDKLKIKSWWKSKLVRIKYRTTTCFTTPQFMFRIARFPKNVTVGLKKADALQTSLVGVYVRNWAFKSLEAKYHRQIMHKHFRLLWRGTKSNL